MSLPKPNSKQKPSKKLDKRTLDADEADRTALLDRKKAKRHNDTDKKDILDEFHDFINTNDLDTGKPREPTVEQPLEPEVSTPTVKVEPDEVDGTLQKDQQLGEQRSDLELWLIQEQEQLDKHDEYVNRLNQLKRRRQQALESKTKENSSS